MNTDISALVKTTIETQIVQAFRDAPSVIDELVKAALGQEVNQFGGSPDRYGDKKMPYLTWLVGDTIRNVAKNAVSSAVEERKFEIQEAVKRAISADRLVDALTQKILGAVSEDYRVNIQFADEEKKGY